MRRPRRRTAGFVAALARAPGSLPPTPPQLATLFASLRLSCYAGDVAKGLAEALAVAESAGELPPAWRGALGVDGVVAAAGACQPMVRGDVLKALLPRLGGDDRRAALDRAGLSDTEAWNLPLASPRGGPPARRGPRSTRF